jgi:hypothetical protein
MLLAFAGCSPKVRPPDPEALKPSWLKTAPYRDGYYTGIGHSVKGGSSNYIQSAKKSALDDLVSQIKVNISSTSVLRQLEIDRRLTEQYEQIIQTTVADEIQEFELVDAWEDAGNYWVYYQLSIQRYRQIKEEEKRNATMLATDYFVKARAAEKGGDDLQAIRYYFQAFRSVEKYLGEALRANIDGHEVLLINDSYASLQHILSRITLQVSPMELTLNRRVTANEQNVVVLSTYTGQNRPVMALPLRATFIKGAGVIFPSYTTNDAGLARILLTKIDSKDLEQTVGVGVDIVALTGTGSSPILDLVAGTLDVPRTEVMLRVQRPVVFLSADERSFGSDKQNNQIINRLSNLLARNGFEFTDVKGNADLWFDVKADAERGSITGSIYVTYLTSVIKVFALRDGIEIYATTLDRVKGYGLDYDKSSVDAYDKAMDALEKERLKDLINTVLQ